MSDSKEVKVTHDYDLDTAQNIKPLGDAIIEAKMQALHAQIQLNEVEYARKRAEIETLKLGIGNNDHLRARYRMYSDELQTRKILPKTFIFEHCPMAAFSSKEYEVTTLLEDFQ